MTGLGFNFGLIKGTYTFADKKYQRGYVSRKAYEDDQEVFMAGGCRSGDLYILLPTHNSTQYCFRQYLTA